MEEHQGDLPYSLRSAGVNIFSEAYCRQKLEKLDEVLEDFDIQPLNTADDIDFESEFCAGLPDRKSELFLFL